MRDLKADLEICKNATGEKWIAQNDDINAESLIHFKCKRNGADVYGDIGIVDGGCNWKKDAHFIAESREGWPEAIERAIKAEEWNAQLEISHELLREKLIKTEVESDRLKSKLANLEDLKLPDIHPVDNKNCAVCGNPARIELSGDDHSFCSFACLNQWAEEC